MLYHHHLLSLCIHFFSWAAADEDRDLEMCGVWNHSNTPLTLHVDVKTGCTGINISATAGTLSIRGSVTTRCKKNETYKLQNPGSDSSSFCVFWEPLLDQLMVKVNSEYFTPCKAVELQPQCCTYLSPGQQESSQQYGIINGSVLGDTLSLKVMAAYEFKGEKLDCSTFPYSYSVI